MLKNAALIFSGIIIFGLVTSACSQPSEAVPSPSPAGETGSLSAITNDKKLKAVYEFSASESGTIALELIESQAIIETQDYGAAGEFVTSINGLAGTNEYYWAFYVNDEYAEQGASQTKLNKDDTIKFVYEAVTPTK